MKLIGRYLSPFTRRVAVSAKILGLPFEHLDLSTATQADEIRKYNPMVRVPTLLLDDGTTLIESCAILDWLDEQAAREKRLVPASGIERRNVLQLVGWATGAGEKTVAVHYELNRRPGDKIHRPFVDASLAQVREAFGVLDRAAADGGWLAGNRLTQADVSAVCFYEFAKVVLPGLFDDAPWSGLAAHCDRAYAAQPAFGETDPKPK